ncbi:hypothetical protein Are01nite_48450 [Actinoplanes regularis]|nr:hypothetical protein Are01nite_48450 [Actinoplanes regularis]
MELYGYDGGRHSRGSEFVLTAERLAADFEVGVEHARWALEELRSFESQPASALVTDGSGLLGEPGFWARDVAALEAVLGLRRVEWLRQYRAEAWPAFTVGRGGTGGVSHRSGAHAGSGVCGAR